MNLFVNIMRKWQHKTQDLRIKEHENDYQVLVEKDIPYLEDGKEYHLLDVYLPQKATQGKFPVIVEVHGGAYVSCYKEVNMQHGQYFSSKGFAVVNMNYTLHPESDMRGEMKEIFAVRNWIQENANKYNFDEDKVFLTGDSAGGHMVLLAGGVQSNENVRSFVGIPNVTHGFRAIAATCPMGELGNLEGDAKKIFRLILGKLLKDADYIQKVDYKNFVTSNFPPLFILTSKEDKLLYKHTSEMHQNLLKMGVAHTYKEYESKGNNLDHVFNVLYPDYPESMEANDDVIEFFLKN